MLRIVFVETCLRFCARNGNKVLKMGRNGLYEWKSFCTTLFCTCGKSGILTIRCQHKNDCHLVLRNIKQNIRKQLYTTETKLSTFQLLVNAKFKNHKNMLENAILLFSLVFLYRREPSLYGQDDPKWSLFSMPKACDVTRSSTIKR
jgi:hypothetical protein